MLAPLHPRKDAEQIWQWREKNPFDLVVMLGDNIYGTTELTHGGDPKPGVSSQR